MSSFDADPLGAGVLMSIVGVGTSVPGGKEDRVGTGDAVWYSHAAGGGGAHAATVAAATLTAPAAEPRRNRRRVRADRSAASAGFWGGSIARWSIEQQ